METEITFLAPDKSTKSVSVGIFPSKGRYYRKKMETKDGIFFHTTIDSTEGKSFYHLFSNDDFEKPMGHLSNIVSEKDPLKRISIAPKTQIFCPIVFFDKQGYIDFVHEDIFELKTISLYGSISQVWLYNNRHESIPFELTFCDKNKKYWNLRLGKNKLTENFLLKVEVGGNFKFFHRNNYFADRPSFDNSFSYRINKLEGKAKTGVKANEVGYQIFPDRFFKRGKVKTNEDFLEWGEQPGYYSYFGGDINGVKEKLDYLKDLGIGFIYLNPIFYSKSSHRYDVIDYKKIDPVLGGEKEFKSFVKQAHQRDIKIVLDIPLNHCGTGFFAFKDVLLNQKESKYEAWFEIKRFPISVVDNPHYSCWNGYKDYPQFNFESKSLREYLLLVSQYWIERFEIDGWRLDCSSEIPGDFIDEFVTHSRKYKKDLLVIGENWSNDRELIKWGANGITNYGLYWDVIIPFFQKKGDLNQLATDILELYTHNSNNEQKYFWNFLSNHDLPRFYSIVENKKMFLSALALVFCLPGTPILYYGEEIFMEGNEDPDNRRCMDWAKTEDNTFGLRCIKSLTRIRNAFHKIFSFGTLGIPFINKEDQILVIARAFKKERLYFVFNFSSKSKMLELSSFSDNSILTDLLTDKLVNFSLNVDAGTYQILKL